MASVMLSEPQQHGESVSQRKGKGVRAPVYLARRKASQRKGGFSEESEESHSDESHLRRSPKVGVDYKSQKH